MIKKILPLKQTNVVFINPIKQIKNSDNDFVKFVISYSDCILLDFDPKEGM